jgi:elongator complex protein 2
VIKLWKLDGATPAVVQTIDLKGKLPLDLQVASLPGSSGMISPLGSQAGPANLIAPILVAGLTDRRIRIYTFANGQFTHALSLEGHEDWVRCLSITPYPASSSSTDSTDLLLASGSQDNYIRLWRISKIDEKETDVPVSHGDGGLDMLDEFERKLAGEAGGSVQISTKAHVLSIDGEEG